MKKCILSAEQSKPVAFLTTTLLNFVACVSWRIQSLHLLQQMEWRSSHASTRMALKLKKLKFAEDCCQHGRLGGGRWRSPSSGFGLVSVISMHLRLDRIGTPRHSLALSCRPILKRLEG